MQTRLATSLLFTAAMAGGLFSQDVHAQVPARKLAPGVVTVIPSTPEEGETFTGPATLVRFLATVPKPAGTPNYSPPSATVHEMAKEVTLRREIWTLEFAFKPVRMIELTLPTADGQLQRQRIWYMVYRVKNVGPHLAPAKQEDGTYTTQPVAGPVRKFPRFFVPNFVLESHEFGKAYLDRIIPLARGPIERREKIPGLRNSVEMSQVEIPVSDERIDRSVWGYATWEAIDPRTDYFSIYVQGLTNAFRIEQQADGSQDYRFKTLQLNFWRPGDSVAEHEGEIRYGVPIVTDPIEQQRIFDTYGIKELVTVADSDDIKERLDYLWIYR